MKSSTQTLNKRKTDSTAIGRAKTVLVFGEDEDAVAVTSFVIVRAFREKDGPRLRFSGAVIYGAETVRHFSEVVLPVVDNICSILGIESKQLEISAVNVGAAAIMDVGTEISGFSADAALFLATLSAALKIPVPNDIVSTGHIASSDGEIRLVKSIPAKLAAAVSDPSITAFVYPSLEGDISLKNLSPSEKGRAEGAICRAKQKIRAIPVHNVLELVETVFTDDAVVQGSLRTGFFGTSLPQPSRPNPLWDTANFLVKDGEPRFMTVLEQHLLAGDALGARKLLDDWVQFYICRQKYPSGFGQKLLHLIQSLPPATRRLKIDFPLMPVGTLINLSQFAKESDHEDVLLLFSPPIHKLIPHFTIPTEQAKPVSLWDADSVSSTVAIVVNEIKKDSLARNIGLPIDTARASYIMDSVTVQSNEEFMEIISAFYVHLLRHTRTISGAADMKTAGPDAYALLERAFSRRNGANAALAEATTGARGGMRVVLDVLTEQFKMEEQEKFVLRVFREAIDPLDWVAKVAFIAAFLKRHAVDFPDEITSAPPERFASKYDIIVRTYVQSMDRVKELLRAL